jgi:multiple sugar transport system permease protein
MAVAVRGGRTSPTVDRMAAGPVGRALAGRPARGVGRVVIIAVILLWSLFPIYWALNVSLSTLSGADSSPAHYVPSPLVGTSYRSVLGIGGAGNGISGQLGRSLLNSVIESGGAMIVTVVIAIFAAYAFARLQFRFKRVSLVNTYLAVILVYVSGFLPLSIWILYNYFNTIPRELEEAAFVDGATPVGALLRIMIPVAMPGIAAAAIIAFLMGWAQFLFPLILTTDLSTQPVTVIVAALDQQRVVPFTLLMACGVIAAAVPGVLALVLNRYIITGVTAGSIK